MRRNSRFFRSFFPAHQRTGKGFSDWFYGDLVYLKRQTLDYLLNGDESRPGVHHVLELRCPSIPWKKRRTCEIPHKRERILRWLKTGYSSGIANNLIPAHFFPWNSNTENSSWLAGGSMGSEMSSFPPIQRAYELLHRDAASERWLIAECLRCQPRRNYCPKWSLWVVDSTSENTSIPRCLALSRGASALRFTGCWFQYPVEPDKGWSLPGPQGSLYSNYYYWWELLNYMTSVVWLWHGPFRLLGTPIWSD